MRNWFELLSGFPRTCVALDEHARSLVEDDVLVAHNHDLRAAQSERRSDQHACPRVLPNIVGTASSPNRPHKPGSSRRQQYTVEPRHQTRGATDLKQLRCPMNEGRADVAQLPHLGSSLAPVQVVEALDGGRKRLREEGLRRGDDLCVLRASLLDRADPGQPRCEEDAVVVGNHVCESAEG